ncbi:hypothetical protein P7C70_g7165, partial [Phenoliferia sp. Uapishka_3]
DLNTWSHATYLLMSAGSLLELPHNSRTSAQSSQINKLLDEIPALFGQKRMMGDPPSVEVWIARKLEAYKFKLERWKKLGWLGLFWNITGRAPAHSLQSQIDRLSAFSPPPRFGPSASASTPSNSPAKSTHNDLETPDEIQTRELLLGVMYRSLKSYPISRQFLQSVIDHEKIVEEDKWIVPFAMLELATLECQEADLEAGSVEGEGAKKVWKERGKKVDKLLEAMFAHGEYDLKSRLESRAGMLRDQVAERRLKLGI